MQAATYWQPARRANTELQLLVRHIPKPRPFIHGILYPGVFKAVGSTNPAATDRGAYPTAANPDPGNLRHKRPLQLGWHLEALPAEQKLAFQLYRALGVFGGWRSL